MVPTPDITEKLTGKNVGSMGVYAAMNSRSVCTVNGTAGTQPAKTKPALTGSGGNNDQVGVPWITSKCSSIRVPSKSRNVTVKLCIGNGYSIHAASKVVSLVSTMLADIMMWVSMSRQPKKLKPALKGGAIIMDTMDMPDGMLLNSRNSKPLDESINFKVWNTAPSRTMYLAVKLWSPETTMFGT
jgi:hypothetical protein